MSKLEIDGRRFIPQRIFCIGKNYADHVKEMGGDRPVEITVFMKPASSLVPVGNSIRLPRRHGIIHHEAEVVFAIGKPGKNIVPEQASEHIVGITLGLDLTLREVQSSLRRQGQPWELSKAFDDSAPLGTLKPVTSEILQVGIEFQCEVNGEVRQRGHSNLMLNPMVRLVSFLSEWWELLEGDLIFTGTPSGVGPLAPGDAIAVSSPQLGRFLWHAI